MTKPIFVGYLVLSLLAFSAKSQLQTGFYYSTCPTVEAIVRSTVEAHFNSDPTIAPGLLRLHFHDCFVQGCDGSVLISGPSAERTALPNLGLRGFEVVDDAKTQLESICPGVVSCADILALAARDAVDLTGGPSWGVPLGRRDGRVSSALDAPKNLPSPLESIAVQRQKFAAKGLDDHDLVTLVDAEFRNTGLERSDKLAKDLEWFKEQGFSIPEPSEPGVVYSRILEELAEKDPQAFICHFYNTYFAHSAGGRMIGRKVAEMILNKKELEFYKWYGDLSELLQNVREKLNKVAEGWTREEKNHCLDETEKSFKHSGEILRLILT